LLDACIRENFPGRSFDADAAVSKTGKIQDALLQALKDHDFFRQAFPKTTGPELFNLHYLEAAKQKSSTMAIPVEDTMATLTKFSADMIVSGIMNNTAFKPGIEIHCSGGGLHNPLLMQHIKDQLPGYSFHSTAENGIPPDAKEAILFALLANECISGEANRFEYKTGIIAVSMGKISFPG